MAFSSLMMSTAAAPSLVCELLPAVTVPFMAKAGRSLASAARLVSWRTPSSCLKTVLTSLTVLPSPTLATTSIGTISASNLPAACAAAARWWLRRAKASCSSRPISYWRATFSAVSPMPR